MARAPLDVNPDASNPTVVVTHVKAGTGHWTLTRNYAVDITSTSHQRVHSHRVRSDRGALLVLPPVGFPGPPPEPGVPITEHRALHKPRQGFRRALRTSRPRCWDACSPVVVALDADSGRIEQHHVTVGRPTVSSAVTASEVPPGTARMLAPLPQEGPQVAKRRIRAAVLEVVGPAPQHRIELLQQDLQRLVQVLPAPRLDLGHDGVQRLLGRVHVDVVLAGSPFPMTLDTPAEEIQPLIDVGHQGLL